MNQNFSVAPILNSPKREQEYFAKQKIIASWGSADNTSNHTQETLGNQRLPHNLEPKVPLQSTHQ